MKQYVKKPIPITALKFTGYNVEPLKDFCNALIIAGEELYIDTLEGKMKVSKGDYVIKGIRGEFYPCKPDIFEESYVEVINE